MRVYGYCRASTSRQVQSPDTQKQIILDHCREQGLEVDDWYTDPATSGKTNLSERLAGNKLMGVLRRGDHVVVARLDRLSRSFADFAVVIQTWSRMGVIVHICDMPGGVLDPSNPMGQLLVHILVAFAQYERQLMRIRIIEGKAAMKAVGRKAGSHAPYGFKFVLHADGHEYLEPDVPEAKVCLEILRLRRLGYSLDSISQHLAYTLKIPSRVCHDKRGTYGGGFRLTRFSLYKRIRHALEIEAMIKEGRWTPPEDMSLPGPSSGPTAPNLRLRHVPIKSRSTTTDSP
jgi:putative DNA-invertase from lambdoid prophage Rac